MSGQKFTSSLVITLLGFGIIFSNQTVFAQSLLPEGSIFVSEINWDGSWVFDNQTKNYKSDGLDEWLELYNPTSSIVDMTEVVIKGAASSSKDLSYKDLSKCKINPQSYLVISRSLTSPTLNGISVCQSTNMSLSNTNINIILSKKDGSAQELQFQGNPTTLITDKNQNNKYSIEKIGGIWVQSQSKIDLIGSSNSSSLPYHHFSSPGYDDFKFKLNIGEKIDVPSLPFDLDIKLESIDGVDIIKQEFSVGTSDCNFTPMDFTPTVTVFATGSYCLKSRFDATKLGISYIGFLDFVFDLTSKTVPIQDKVEGIVISEVDLNEDKIELYNSNNYEINLSDFTLEDVVGATKKNKLLGLTLKPSEYTILDVKNLGITLNNNGDNVILKDNQGNIVSQTFIKVGVTIAKDYSWQYFTDSKNWEEQPSTLGRENERVPSADTSDTNKQVSNSVVNSKDINYFANNIRINEIYPQGEEYVELYNKGDSDLDISGLVLHDEMGKTGKITLGKDTIIGSKKYLTLLLKSKISLNNDGDGLIIMTTQGDKVDGVHYDFARDKDLSYQFFEDGWSWEAKTQNTENNKTLNKQNVDSVEVENQDKKTICQELDILIQITKNTYYSNLGKIYLANIPKQKLPHSANICNIKPRDDYNQGVFDTWSKPIKLNSIAFGDTTQKIEGYSFVNFNLECKGKKNADVSRDDVIFRVIYKVKKPECVNHRVYGLGFVFTLDENFILYFIDQTSQNLGIVKNSVNTKKKPKKKIGILKNTNGANISKSKSDLYNSYDFSDLKNQFKLFREGFESKFYNELLDRLGQLVGMRW